MNFFAETEIQFFWTQFGLAGFLIVAIGFVTVGLFNLWLKFKEKEYAKFMDVQRDTQLEALKQASKRDEIRFNSYHAKQVELIAELYSALVELHWHALGVIPGGPSFALDKVPALMNAIEKVEKFIRINEIYFADALVEKLRNFLNELQRLCIDKQSITPGSPQSGNAMMQSWETLSKGLPTILKSIRKELKIVLEGKD